MTLDEAIWAGDVDWLAEHYRCICCCDEHTFDYCPARAWFGCRGSDTLTREEEASWLRHYQQAHGMTEAQFYGASS